jgi:hypothetical protein
LLRFLLCMSLCYKLSPFQAFRKSDTAPVLSVLRVYLQFMWEVGLPSSPVEFLSLCHSHKLSRSWLLDMHPRSRQRLSGQAGFFIYYPRKGSLPPILGAQCAPPSFPRVFIALIAYYSVSLFLPKWRLVCPGGYAALAQVCLWEYRVPWISPGPCLPKPSGCRWLR